VVSELRSFTFKASDGKQIKGAEFIDPVWRGMVQWHAVTNVEWDREQTRKDFAKMFIALPNGDQLIRQFYALEQKEAA
jgi:hypothetical protein